MNPFSGPSRTRARAGLALVAVAGCGALAPVATASASAPTVPGAGGATTATAHNGPIAFTGGTSTGIGWVEVNPDGSDNGGRHEVVPVGGGLTPQSMITDVVFSPDGAKAAFVQDIDGTLWTANADGTGAKQLTTANPSSVDEFPSWSADGATVYFSRTPIPATSTAAPGIPQLMSVPAAGGTAKAVLATTDPGGDGSAAASPDGTKLAYVALDAAGGSSVVVVNAKTHALIGTIPNSYRPQFSPDGKNLAAVTVTATSGGVFLYPVSGLTAAAPQGVLAVPMSASTPVITTFTFSPDGTELAYETFDVSAKTSALHVEQLSTGTVTDAGVTEMVLSDLTWQNGPLYTGPVTAAPAQPVTTPTNVRPAAVRLGGADRIDTSVATADALYGNPAGTGGPGAKVAVISRSDSYADALAGNALAAQKQGPLLLTDSARLDQRVAAELTKTLAPHATVYVLGGVKALSPQIDADIAALGFTPKRIAGADRFETATDIAAQISAHPHTVLVATGTNFPDALAAGAAAATDPAGGVVVLTDGASVPAATKSYLAGVDPAAVKVYGVGGQAVTALGATPPFANRFTPLAGGDRFATALAVASDKNLFPAATTFAAGMATGANWPDALSGGAFIGALRGPLLLTDGSSVPSGELGWLAGHGTTLKVLAVFGGTGVVPQTAVTQAGGTAWGPGNWDSLSNNPALGRARFTRAGIFARRG